MKTLLGAALTSGMLIAASGPATAYDLSPKGTKFDREATKEWAAKWLDGVLSRLAERGVEHFKEPVHEEITHRIFNCKEEGPAFCGNPDAEFASPYIVAGVRWNDDPPFQMLVGGARGTPCKTRYDSGQPMTIRFITQPACWGALFLAAKDEIQRNPNAAFNAESQAILPLRSHFGDMQFLHSMASVDGEAPEETRTRILGWAEFTWKVANGSYGLGTWLKDVEVPVIRETLGRSGWRVQDLFTLGDPTLRNHVPEVAFGSLLHMVEDSFAAGHVERLEAEPDGRCGTGNLPRPGPIREFHSYTHQDSKAHAAADSRQAFATKRQAVDVVDVGRALKDLRRPGVAWEDVSAYLTCVYDFAPNIRHAGAGDF